MKKALFNRKVYICLFVFLGILAMISLFQGCKNAVISSQDFQWDAAKVFTLRINPYDESMNPSGILDGYNYDEYYLQMEANQFPSLLMILIPFTWLQPLVARYVWLIFNVFLTGVMIYLLRKTFLKDIEQKEFLVLVLLMIAGTPFRNHLGVGQHTIFAFTFFLLAVYLSEYCPYFNEDIEDNKVKYIARIVLVALCLFICYFKYTLTVPLVLYFVYKKRYMEIVISVIPHIFLTAVASAWLNDSIINMILKPLKVSSALATEGGLDISALLKGSYIAYGILLIVMIFLFVLSLKANDGLDISVMAVLILWSLIITYHRTYDFFVLAVVPAMFYELNNYTKDNFGPNDAITKSLVNCYRYSYLTIFAVFFVLRVFSENMFSKIVVGVIYYTLVFWTTGLLCYFGFKKHRSV